MNVEFFVKGLQYSSQCVSDTIRLLDIPTINTDVWHISTFHPKILKKYKNNT